MLILDDGASREDLMNTEKLYPYLKEHALDWFQFANDYSDLPPSRPRVNGTLFVVTGCDKANLWNNAVFPPFGEDGPRQTVFRFEEAPDSTRYWDNELQIKGFYSIDANPSRYPCALFLRGISLALSLSSWTRNMATFPPETIPLYVIPSSPVQESRSRVVRIFERYRYRKFDQNAIPSLPNVRSYQLFQIE